MALKITEDCINCDACEPACPNQAITQGEFIYEISPNRCTECVGHFEEPQCVIFCPVACIIKDDAYPETKAALLDKASRLKELPK